MKKLLFTLLSVMFVLSASAETITGKAGSNINWSYDTETYTLTFTGSGAMPNYSSSLNTPWGKTVSSIYTDRKGNVTNYYITDDVEKIIIGSGITSIGNFNFDCCGYLKNVELASSVKSIGSNAFNRCANLATITGTFAPDLSIGENAFNATPLISNNTLYLGTNLVQVYPEYSSSTLSIKSGTTKINANAISGCSSITSITIPNTVTTIGDNAFEETGITSITIPNSVSSIGKDVFANTKIANVTFNANIKTFGTWFEGITTLKSINIPSSVTAISSDAFNGCTALSNITFANANNITSWGSNIFNGCASLPGVVDGCVLIKATEQDAVEARYEISSDIAYIAENAFAHCGNVTYLDLRDCTTPPALASSALSGITGFKTIVKDGYESNFAKGTWGEVNTTNGVYVPSEKYTTCTFLHNAIVPEGIAVYTAVVAGDKVEISKINDGNKSIVVPAGIGFLLRAETATTANFGKAGSKATVSVGANDLVGVMDYKQFSSSGTDYVLQTQGGSQKFLKAGDKAFANIGKAYLDGTSLTSSAAVSTFDLFDVTGIDEVETPTQSNAKTGIYNMNGQRLSSPQEGINIINGKKYIVK